MHEEHIEISTTVAAIVMIFPAFIALSVVVLGVCVGLGVPAFVPGSIVLASVAGVARKMRKGPNRRIGRGV